jgi:hypothetical protein
MLHYKLKSLQVMHTFSIRSVSWLLALALVLGCTKEEIKVYEVKPVTLYQSASEKSSLKSDDQFLAILFTDLYGKSISAQEMAILVKAYSSFGDKSLVINMMTKSMLADPSSSKPTDAAMRADVGAFVEETFMRFYVRKPTEQERWFFINRIEQDIQLRPIDIYYVLITANEYRYY